MIFKSKAERERESARELAQIAAFEAARQVLMDKWRAKQLEAATITVLPAQVGRLAPYERSSRASVPSTKGAKRKSFTLRA